MGLRRIGAAAFAALLITSLAACGDDDGGDEAGINLEDVDGDSSGDSSDDSGDSGDSDDDSTDASDVESAIEGAFSDGCGEFAEVFGALGASIAGAFDEEAAEEFEGFLDDAPDEIRDDLQTLADAYAGYAEALEDAGIDLSDPSSIDPSDLDGLEAIATATEAFNEEDVLEASENINEFVASNCET